MAPIHKKNQKVTPNIDYSALRERGAKNLDLWVNGELYPVDPVSNSHPDFNTITGLCRFVCLGKSGLLGYCKNLEGNRISLEQKIQDLSVKLHHLNQSYMVVYCENMRLNQTITVLNQRHVNALLEEKSNSVKEIQKLKIDLRRLQKRHSRLKGKKNWLRIRPKKLKPIACLKRGGGGYRKRVFGVRSMLDENCPDFVDLCKKVLKKSNMEAMLKQPEFHALRKEVVNQFIANLRIDVKDVQGVCDDRAISREAYASIFKVLREGMLNVGIKKTVVPRPFHVMKERALRNTKIVDSLGNAYHLEAMHEVASKNKKKVPSEIIPLIRNNNMWYDLERVLQLMVRYYDISTEEACGKLVVVLKLDEMELVNMEKYERVSITLMNHALDPSLDKTSDKYFQVQSEEHLFWLGIFRVNKESHESLKFVFSKTDLPSIMSSHAAGEKLYVEGYGSYFVEWHLAADLKTLKCMYNVSHGANAMYSFLYCMHIKQKDRSWKGGILSCPQNLPPNRDELDPNIDAVLPIPLIRVHMCTLHAFVRIVDKMVYLSIMFAWNKTPQTESKKSIEAIESVLSKAGLHGGHVKIEKDIKRSGTRGNIPAKPSISGVKARRFLENKCGHGCWGLYEQLIDAEDDRTSGGRESSRKKKCAWRSLSSLFLLMEKDKFMDGDAIAFQEVVTDFIKAMKEAWGDNHMTHYMVCIQIFIPPELYLLIYIFYYKFTTFGTLFWYSKIN